MHNLLQPNALSRFGGVSQRASVTLSSMAARVLDNSKKHAVLPIKHYNQVHSARETHLKFLTTFNAQLGKIC